MKKFKEHLTWDDRKLKKIYVSDWYKIHLHSYAREYVRWPVWERKDAHYAVKFVAGHGIVCSYITSDCRRKLIKVDWNSNNENYVSLQRSNLLPVKEGKEIVQHNDAPCQDVHLMDD